MRSTGLIFFSSALLALKKDDGEGNLSGDKLLELTAHTSGDEMADPVEEEEFRDDECLN